PLHLRSFPTRRSSDLKGLPDDGPGRKLPGCPAAGENSFFYSVAAGISWGISWGAGPQEGAKGPPGLKPRRPVRCCRLPARLRPQDRKSTRLDSSHVKI